MKQAIKKTTCLACHCFSCESDWTSKGDKVPLKCPRCGSPNWKVPVEDRRKVGRPRGIKG